MTITSTITITSTSTNEKARSRWTRQDDHRPAQDGYKQTINLPLTAFPMQAKLPEREPLRLVKWQAEDLAGQILKRRAGAPNYCLHDGPPYANGDIHIGHRAQQNSQGSDRPL